MRRSFADLFNQSTKVVEQCDGCVNVNEHQECDRWVRPVDKWAQPGGCETFEPSDPAEGSGDPDPEEPTSYY